MEPIALHQDVLHKVIGLIPRALSLGVQGADGGLYLKVVISVNAGYLLDDIRLDGHILGGPPAGHLYREPVPLLTGLKAQGQKRPDYPAVLYLNARVSVHIGLVKAQLHLGIALDIHVRKPGYHLGLRVDVQQQLHEPADSGHGHLRVQGLLIAHGRVGAKAQPCGGLAHRSRVEVRRLQEQAVRIVLYLRVKPAHDTGHCNRGIACAYHQSILVNLPLRAVQGGEGKGRVKALHPYAVHLGAVKGVHGLAHLQHEIVGQVRQKVYSPAAAVKEPYAHIHWADLLGDVAHLKPCVPIT